MNKLSSLVHGGVWGALAALLFAVAAALVVMQWLGKAQPSGPSPRIVVDDLAVVQMEAALDADSSSIQSLRVLLISHAGNLNDKDVLAGKFQPRLDTPIYQIVFPINWADDPFEDNNWRFQFHAWRSIAPSLYAFQRTGEARYWEHALHVIQDWGRFHIEEGREAEFSWYDMSTAFRALSIAYVLDRYRAGAGALTEDEKRMLLVLAGRHIARLREPGFFKASNHGIFQMHALMSLCVVLADWSPCSEARDYAAAQLYKLMRNQFGEEGVHLEQSPFYHLFALDYFKRLLDSGWYDDYSSLRALAAKGEVAADWMVDARGLIPNVGDSEPVGPRPARPVRDVTCAAETDSCFAARMFEEAGYGVIRTPSDTHLENAQSVFFTCGFHNLVHKHDDELSFEWVVGGKGFVTDTGKFSYDHDEVRAFTISRPAHSTLDFHHFRTTPADRKRQGGCVESVFVDEAGRGRIAGVVDYDDGELVHRRELTLAQDASRLVVADTLSGVRKTPFTVWWHFDPAFELDAAEGKGVYVASDGETDIEISFDQSACVASLKKGIDGRQLQGWVSYGYREWTPRWSLGFECPAKVRAVVTTFSVTRAPFL